LVISAQVFHVERSERFPLDHNQKAS
jgi:hypothetical protein